MFLKIVKDCFKRMKLTKLLWYTFVYIGDSIVWYGVNKHSSKNVVCIMKVTILSQNIFLASMNSFVAISALVLVLRL